MEADTSSDVPKAPPSTSTDPAVSPKEADKPPVLTPGVANIKAAYLLCNQKTAETDPVESSANGSASVDEADPLAPPPLKVLKSDRAHGMNRGRRKQQNRRPALDTRLCPSLVFNDRECRFGPDKCRYAHDVHAFMAAKPPDLSSVCPIYDVRGFCPYGVACRFAGAHLDGVTNVRDDAKSAAWRSDVSGGNWPPDLQKRLRSRQYDFDFCMRYLARQKLHGDIIVETPEDRLGEVASASKNAVIAGPSGDNDLSRPQNRGDMTKDSQKDDITAGADVANKCDNANISTADTAKADDQLNSLEDVQSEQKNFTTTSGVVHDRDTKCDTQKNAMSPDVRNDSSQQPDSTDGDQHMQQSGRDDVISEKQKNISSLGVSVTQEDNQFNGCAAGFTEDRLSQQTNSVTNEEPNAADVKQTSICSTGNKQTQPANAVTNEEPNAADVKQTSICSTGNKQTQPANAVTNEEPNAADVKQTSICSTGNKQTQPANAVTNEEPNAADVKQTSICSTGNKQTQPANAVTNEEPNAADVKQTSICSTGNKQTQPANAVTNEEPNAADVKQTSICSTGNKQTQPANAVTNEEPNAADVKPAPIGVIVDDDMVGRLRRRVAHIASGKTYLAPLTTVGNLPFRRVCTEFGAEVTCGEMALATSLLQGNQSEFSLLKRHESEQFFGVQVCGGFPDIMMKCSQLIADHCDVSFVDVNLGCPIDVVCQKGGGAALMDRVVRLRQVLSAMSCVLTKAGIPLTIKVRTGLHTNKPTAHAVLPRVVFDTGVAAVTMHGRSKDQRYTKSADWGYVNECARLIAPMPMLACGDVLSFHDYYQQLDAHAHVKGVMIGRGALIKPWLFTEIHERRDWDISAGERFDILKKFVNYGLLHWGSDQQGVETTRRFLLEWLSFLHRYIPLGVLERVPQRMNEKPPRFVGRDELETLLASDRALDWLRISERLLGPPPPGFVFVPKHKASAY